MEKNFKQLLIKSGIFLFALVLIRAIFQFPIEYYAISVFKQTSSNRIFSKIDAIKVLTLVGLFFAFYYRNKISTISHPKINKSKSIIYMIAGFVTVGIYYFLRASTNIYSINSTTLLFLIWLGILLTLIIAFICVAISVFDYDYLIKFYQKFTNEIVFTGLISIFLYYILIYFQSKWYLFSGFVANALYFFLSLFLDVMYYIGEDAPVLQINDFAVSIGSPCSGIDSMLLFFSFFIALFALDHKKIKTVKFFIFFVIGFIGVVFVNIIRLLLLILVGVFISPKFAVGLFHTNAGWMFFLIYFLLYYWFIRKFIYDKIIIDDKKKTKVSKKKGKKNEK